MYRCAKLFGYAVVSFVVTSTSAIQAESYGKFLDQGNSSFEQTTTAQEQWLEGEQAADRRRAQESAARAAERERNRDKSNDFCFAIENDDARNACLGEPYLVKNERARNILLGNCFAFDTSTDFSRHLEYICNEGRRGCSLLDNASASYQCNQCGGTRQWVATYSLGVIIQCW